MGLRIWSLEIDIEGKVTCLSREEEHICEESAEIMELDSQLPKMASDREAWCKDSCMKWGRQRLLCDVKKPCPFLSKER